MTELGLGDDQSGEHRPHRHRQAGCPGECRDAQAGKQGEGHEAVGLAARGEMVEHRSHQPPADQVDGAHGGHRLEHRDTHQGEETAVAGLAHDGHQHQQRHHREILEQQDREGRLAHRRPEFAALAEQLHHHRGGGERQHQAQHHRGFESVVPRPGDAADGQGRQPHLQTAGAEHQAAHRPQPLHRHLQADGEHQRDHAQLGEGLDVLGVAEGHPMQPWMLLGNASQPERADQGADRQEAEYRIDAYPLQQWNQYPCEGQEEDGFAEVGQCVCFGHRRVE